MTVKWIFTIHSRLGPNSSSDAETFPLPKMSSLPHLPLPLPSIDIFLDSSLIPSLPPPGGKGYYHDLMGRRTGSTSKPLPAVPPEAPTNSRYITSSGIARIPGRLEVGQVVSGTAAVAPMPALRGRSVSIDSTGGREKSAPGISKAGIGRAPLRSSSQQDRPTHLVPPRPGSIRRTSSFEERLPRKNAIQSAHDRTVGSEGKGGKSRHGRTNSDSTITSGPRRRAEDRVIHRDTSELAVSSSVQISQSADHPARTVLKHNRSASWDPPGGAGSAIPLGTTEDLPQTTKLLHDLSSLIPPSRMPSSSLPNHASCSFHPSSLLVPLSLILEALVAERSVLRSIPAPSLPLLPDGASFQSPSGEGELDWLVVQGYILSLGTILDSLLPYLRESENGEREAVGELMRGVRMYVSKLKKVFGEVAVMYVDGYGFVKGFWDEGGMKSAAGEVGRWGDLFDV